MTLTSTKMATSHNVTEEAKDSLVLLDVLKAVGQCKISKEGKDSELHPLLDRAFAEAKKQKAPLRDYVIEVFLRNLFYSFSIQRQHNVWKNRNIKSQEIGAQMRNAGRSIARWLDKNLPEWLYAPDRDGYLHNLNLLVEFANYDLLTHNQIRTKTKAGTGKAGSKRDPNRFVSYETMYTPEHITAKLMAQNYRKSMSLSLIARWLPKYTTGRLRSSKLVVGKDIKRKFFDSTGKQWVKVNDTKYEGATLERSIPIKEGDIVSYSRMIQKESLKRRDKDNILIRAFCKEMDWDLKQYTAFRHQYMQLTPEHQFSSGKINRMTRDQFFKWVDGLSAGQQWVVSSTLCYKDKAGNLAPRPGSSWEKTQLPKWYMEWSQSQTKVAEQIRVAMATGDTEKVKQVAQQSKVKTTGLQTVDILQEIFKGGKTENELNTLHTNLIAKMNMFVPIFCIIDGSGSMGAKLIGNTTRLDVALTLAITFMVTNPVEEYRSACMWFGAETTFSGYTKYVNNSPNPFVEQSRFIQKVNPMKVCDPAWTFTKNLKSLMQANPGHMSSTNAGQTVTTFMKLVEDGKLTVEQLPKVLLFLTDEEYNKGVGPVEGGRGFTELPRTIGWNPLFVFWGLVRTTGLDKYANAPNTLVVRGYAENILSQVLQFIRKGSINIYDELFAVHSMPGLSLINYPARG